MKEQDHRAIALPDRVTIAHALHCHFLAPDRHADQETLGTLLWLIRRFGMHNISQAHSAIPVSIWRVIDSIFPGEMIKSQFMVIRRLAQQIEAEKAAAAALSAIEGALITHQEKETNAWLDH